MSEPRFEQWSGPDSIRRSLEGHGEIVLDSGRIAKFDWDHLEIILAHRWHVLVIGRTAYLRTRTLIDGKKIMKGFHQMILACPSGMVRDHINRDGLDNRLSNLRVVTKSDNALNAAGHRDAKVGAVGVYRDRRNGRYIAGFRGKYIGVFGTAEEASAAREAAAAEYRAKAMRLKGAA